jgi:hypothetical protein
MSTQTISPAPLDTKARAVEFAKKYPFRDSDGHFGPVTVANVNRYEHPTDSTKDRDIVNLCLRTPNSQGTNATISAPAEWNKFSWVRPGMLVEVVMERGFIKKIIKSVAEPVNPKKGIARVINDDVTAAMEAMDAEAAVNDLIEETSNVPAKDLVLDDKPF